MKSKYWTCSKFADWLRGIPQPSSATAKEWNAWEKMAKEKKFRYWLAEEGLDYLQKVICWPVTRFRAMRCYINNRWVVKTHALTSTLKRGERHEFDTRLLHTIFNELVNFVEIEKAWMQVISSKEEEKKYKIPWYRTIFRLGSWRSPEAGIAYLQWEAGLKNDEDWADKNHSQFGQPTLQALAATETLALYNWWKQERSQRPDPAEVSGWRKHCEEQREAAKARGEDPLLTSLTSSDKEQERITKILDLYGKLEQAQEDEDTAMLIRVIKVRQNLWT